MVKLILKLAPLVLIISAAGCGADNGDDAVWSPDAALTPQNGKSLVTEWPIVFSHAWSRVADTAFQGDEKQHQPGAEYDHYGIKLDLESQGVTVFQPDKLAYASNERRGQLLYKKCAGITLDDILCRGENPEVVDGIHHATLQYCGDSALRQRHGFVDQASCQKGMQFNVICHSQGCPDSRYMLAAVTNEFSGELMYKHVASWTSMVGANKGTSQADFILEALAACLTPACRSVVLDAAFAVDSFSKNEALITEGGESVVALSRKYMLVTTDMDCTPGRDLGCAPSFNELYPLPEDPDFPVFYQTFSTQINDINHPCYLGDRTYWEIVMSREGPNDGNISVDSQQFTTYGPGSTGGETPVFARWISGVTSDPDQPHPGLNHMAFNDSDVPGINGVSCMGEDNSAFHFSRIEMYRNIVGELAGWGY